MRILVLAAVALAAAAATASAQLQPTTPFTNGYGYNPHIESDLVAADGTHLGRVTVNPFDADSISNPSGLYGSRFSRTSIRNPFGRYGSPFSPSSAFNDFAPNPPRIIQNNRVVGIATTNPHVPGAVNPRRLLADPDR